MKFSIIVPVYNSEKYIEECMNSIENQSFQDYEIICINDGSNDTSLDLLKKHQKINKKIKIISITHKNAGVARNEGLKTANGDYLCFLDSDDYYDKNALITINRMIQIHNNPDIIIFKVKEKNEINKTIRKNKESIIETNCPKTNNFSPDDMKDNIFNSFGYWAWNKVYKKSFIRNNNITFQDINRSNDVMFVSISLVKAKTICIVNKYLIIHRSGHGTNMQSNNAREPIAFWNAFLETKNKLSEDLGERYVGYERSYLNSVLKAFKDYLYSMAYNQEAYEYARTFIKNNAEKDFSFLEHDEYYYDKEVYEWYVKLINTNKIIKNELNKGKLITNKVIKIKKSIKDNGIIYTINRILFHMNLREDNDPLRTYNTRK